MYCSIGISIECKDEGRGKRTMRRNEKIVRHCQVFDINAELINKKAAVEFFIFIAKFNAALIDLQKENNIHLLSSKYLFRDSF